MMYQETKERAFIKGKIEEMLTAHQDFLESLGDAKYRREYERLCNELLDLVELKNTLENI